MARRLSSRLVATASAAAWPFRRLGVLPRRAYGSAAAALCDDYYYGCYSEDEERVSQPRLETGRMVPERGLQWVIMGDRGAKKHLYAERLSKLLQVPHISMGSLVRQELNPRSSLYKQIANALNESKLVPEHVIFALLTRRLEEGYDRGEMGFILEGIPRTRIQAIANALNESKLVPEHVIFALLTRRLEEGYDRGEMGFILEGIPRTRIQAEILDQIADIDLVLNFKCTEECTSVHRSPLCPKVKPQDEELISADLAWKERFAFYAEESKLLEEYYSKQRKLLNFQVASAPVETWKGLLAALHLQHMNIIDSSSQKLTA